MAETTETKRSGTINLGNLNESLLACLTLLKHLQSGKPFSLSNNLEKAGAFDDVVSRANNFISFLQTKHTKNAVNSSTLLSMNNTNDNFCIFKYLLSFIQIIYSISENNESVFFKGNYDELDVDFILQTIASIKIEKSHNFIAPIDNFNHALKTNPDQNGSQSIVYKIDYEKLPSETLQAWSEELKNIFAQWMAKLINLKFLQSDN